MNIFTSLEQLDNTVRIAGLRSLVHSCFTRGIGALRQHINAENRQSRQELDPEDEALSLDLRNEVDMRAQGGQEPPAGLTAYQLPIELARQLKYVADVALTELYDVLHVTQYDAPMTFEAMLTYMSERPQPVSRELVQAVCDHLAKSGRKVNFDQMMAVANAGNTADRIKLLEVSPQVLDLWTNQLGEGYGHDSDFDELELQVRLGLIVKTVNGIKKSSERMLNRIFQTKRLSDLSNVSILDDGVAQLTTQLQAFEQRNAGEISALIEAGRTIPELLAA